MNYTTEVKGKKLIITVDLEGPTKPSTSGKSDIIATTSGFSEVAPGVKLGLNVIKAKAK